MLTTGITPESLFIPMALLFLLLIVWLKFMRLWFVMKSCQVSPRRGRRLAAGEGAAVSPRTPYTLPHITLTLSPSDDPPPNYDQTMSRPIQQPHEETPPPCYAEAVKET